MAGLWLLLVSTDALIVVVVTDDRVVDALKHRNISGLFNVWDSEPELPSLHLTSVDLKRNSVDVESLRCGSVCQRHILDGAGGAKSEGSCWGGPVVANSIGIAMLEVIVSSGLINPSGNVE